ncbi:AAA family ATPase [Lacticaseibacillus zeae]|uniref:AAA family ATPase n=1 Tax=Lacticaseibacillus zeae subsp. silagei TaxID=3068307 RepID=A0ABD7ZA01_LACZE|nr:MULTISPECIES: AAA family ATPase [Lacticaseibacillus]MDE3316300.1 AAA family ATPase [Lacticaseibacillus zeae]OFR90414.1 nucleotide kinase [Lactobacillus sp. HMSC068F07]WLV83827.1 AAA family ATPase [Lacticaseibacillus sp. NCIMB 15475]WLV86583.1 AAA family ATPase [Lacticaseibacillus sp. NCIMB 15474]
MKTLYLIGGTMGVGKTAVCQQLKKDLPQSVFLDGDWCWDSDPFQVIEETKLMVMDNICHLLNNFLACSAYKNVIFCWVMHQQTIIDTIINSLHTENCTVKCVSLIANEQSLRERLEQDVAAGIRSMDVIEKSISRMPLYQKINTTKIDTNGKTIQMVADEIKHTKGRNK